MISQNNNWIEWIYTPLPVFRYLRQWNWCIQIRLRRDHSTPFDILDTDDLFISDPWECDVDIYASYAKQRNVFRAVEGPAKELLAFFSFSQYILFVFFYYFYFYVISILWFKKSKAMATKQTHSLDTFQIDSHSVLWWRICWDETDSAGACDRVSLPLMETQKYTSIQKNALRRPSQKAMVHSVSVLNVLGRICRYSWHACCLLIKVWLSHQVKAW